MNHMLSPLGAPSAPQRSRARRARTTIPALLLLAASCSTTSGLLTSLEDITTEVDRQGLTDVNQTRVLSLTGLLAPSYPGEIHRFKKERATSTAIGLTSGDSHFVEATIPSPANPQVAIDKLRDKMIDLREAAARVVATRLDVVAAREAPPEDTALRSTLASRMQRNQTARSTFDRALKDAMQQVQPGMLVFRWASDSSVAAKIALDDLVGASGSTQRQSSGFAIACGIRASTLVVGPDIKDVRTGQVPKWHWWESKFPWILAKVLDEDVRLTTHTLQAQHITWFQDVSLSRRVAAHIKASASQIGSAAKTLKELDKIEIDFVLASLENVGNMGSMHNVARVKRDDVFEVGQEQARLNGTNTWHTFYYVDTHLEDLRNLYKE